MGRRQHSLATCKWVDRDLLQREKFAGGRVFVNAFTSKEYYISKLELTVLRFYVVDFPPKKVAGKLFCFALFNSFFTCFSLHENAASFWFLFVSPCVSPSGIACWWMWTIADSAGSCLYECLIVAAEMCRQSNAFNEGATDEARGNLCCTIYAGNWGPAELHCYCSLQLCIAAVLSHSFFFA